MKLLDSIRVHESYDDFFNDKILLELEDIEKKIGDELNPDIELALRFLEKNIYDIKVVILGQDPYPQKGVATGRAFEVGGLENWTDKFRQVSLKNIVRLLYKNYNYIDSYEDIKKFSELKPLIESSDFTILPPNQLFENWEKQGVLLLNATFTLFPGKSNSHEKIWAKFSDELIKYISSKNSNISWFLWGNFSIKKGRNIVDGMKYESNHPMMCSAKKDKDFLKSNCFRDTMNVINWLGL